MTVTRTVTPPVTPPSLTCSHGIRGETRQGPMAHLPSSARWYVPLQKCHMQQAMFIGPAQYMIEHLALPYYSFCLQNPLFPSFDNVYDAVQQNALTFRSHFGLDISCRCGWTHALVHSSGIIYPSTAPPKPMTFHANYSIALSPFRTLPTSSPSTHCKCCIWYGVIYAV